MKTAEQYKKLTISEFTKAAEIYETDHAGIYEIRSFCDAAGLKIEKLERGKKFRLHLVAGK